MRAHATRTTCFAIISAIEDDLRALVRQGCDLLRLADLLPSDVRTAASARWQKDNRSSAQRNPEDDLALLHYTDFVDLAKTLQFSFRGHQDTIAIDIRSLANHFELLSPIRNRVCHTRPLEADDLLRCLDIADEVLKLHRSSFPTLQQTLRSLKDSPTSLLHIRIPPYWSPDSDIHHNLPLPEFDDTGFFGRGRDRREVHNLLRSHHPVLTIVGEGGVGKTALAQRCLYDLLDEPDQSLDAIVWVSLKARSLTPGGVRDIGDAITSALGLLGSIAHNLGTPQTSERSPDYLVDEIAEYLSEYRVLLAIDNLETLQGANLRSLLVKIPPTSKLLITSRVGLGEFEMRYSLDPLDSRTGVALMRRFARFLALAAIYKLKDGALEGYCKKLFYNPLLIKWFVASVSRGADPASLLDRDGDRFQDALDFCCARLFDQLSAVEWALTETLAAAKRPLTLTELQFLCETAGSLETETALASLHNSSLLRRDALKSGTFTYRISEPAVAYVTRTRPPNRKLYHTVSSKLKELRHLSERERVTQAQ